MADSGASGPSRGCVFSRLRGLLAGAAAAVIVGAPIAAGAEMDAPSWKKAGPGVRAFLGEDGEGDWAGESVTVCNTADRYRQWLVSKHSSGCRKFRRGLKAIVEEMIFDPRQDTIDVGGPIGARWRGFAFCPGIIADIFECWRCIR